MCIVVNLARKHHSDRFVDANSLQTNSRGLVVKPSFTLSKTVIPALQIRIFVLSSITLCRWCFSPLATLQIPHMPSKSHEDVVNLTIINMRQTRLQTMKRRVLPRMYTGSHNQTFVGSPMDSISPDPLFANFQRGRLKFGRSGVKIFKQTQLILGSSD